MDDLVGGAEDGGWVGGRGRVDGQLGETLCHPPSPPGASADPPPHPQVFVDIVISLGATYGLYLIGSILYLEPWHMLTSFIQYLLLLPAFANVLPIYSFANLHDLAWGTKGDTSVKNLGGAKTTGEKGEVEVKIPTAPEDVDALWLEMKRDVGTPIVEKKVKRDVHAKQADHVSLTTVSAF